MNGLILIAGLAMVVALAVAAVRPAWRLPVLAFGLLAIPGNVDDLLPSMTMDLHDLAGATAPAITVSDLLLGWALALTLYERRAMGREIGNVVILGLVVAAIATISAGIAVAGGVEPTAAVRGALIFIRIPVYLYVAGALRAELGDGRLLALAIVAGGVLLIGNGVFTTIVDDPGRFTARTFGRNGLAVALTVVAVVATGVAAHLVDRFGLRRWQSWVAIGCSVVAIASVFAMTQTGTRMALLLLLGSSLLAIIAFPKSGLRARTAPGRSVVGGILVLTLAASNLTVAGSRSISIVDPGATLDAVGDLEGSQATSELRSRGMFWQSALAMARANPLFGVGPFQWNIQRYEMDPTEPVLVVDPHLSYLQVAAEFGIPTLIGYLALLAAAARDGRRQPAHDGGSCVARLVGPRHRHRGRHPAARIGDELAPVQCAQRAAGVAPDRRLGGDGGRRRRAAPRHHPRTRDDRRASADHVRDAGAGGSVRADLTPVSDDPSGKTTRTVLGVAISGESARYTAGVLVFQGSRLAVNLVGGGRAGTGGLRQLGARQPRHPVLVDGLPRASRTGWVARSRSTWVPVASPPRSAPRRPR